MFKDCRIIIPSECLIIADGTARADYIAEVYADKIAGSNHTLPTCAAARYTGDLWVGMLLKVVTHMEVDGPASLKLAGYAETQSAYEGMDAHRFAAAIRLSNLKE